MWRVLFAALIVLCAVVRDVNGGYKILGVFPNTSRSHYIVGSALMRALAARGHQVTVITLFPSGERVQNYEEIPIPEVNEYFKDLYDTLQEVGEKSFIRMYVEMVLSGRQLSEKVLEQPAIQDLLSSTNRTFDLVISEIFVTDALFGFAQHFNAPVIGISPMGNCLWASVLSGAPMPASFMPNIFLGNTQRMSFSERLMNLAAISVQYLGYHLQWLPYQAKVYEKFFPNAKVTLQEALKNVSLVLLNQHVSIGNPEPLLQNMIEVGGLHIQRKAAETLVPEIKEFLDNATNGAIYFSLGTNWRSESLHKDKIDAIMTTFRSLKQKVLWKHGNSSQLGESENILTRDWFPQFDILAHPNVKLFITHGGLLGTTEAVYHGKPILGIPMLCDQFINVARASAEGYGLEVLPNQLTAKKFKSSIKELLENPHYTNRAKLVAGRYRDQPMEPLDTAVYWVEYVLRHRGAPHLRSAALDLNFFQYHSLDTIPVMYGAVFLFIYLIFRFLKRLVSSVVGADKDLKLKSD